MQERTEEILSALRTGDLEPVRAETEKRLKKIKRSLGRGILTVNEAMILLQADQYSWDRRKVFAALGLHWPLPAEDWRELRGVWHDAVRGIERELPADGPERDRAERLRDLLRLLTALAVPVFSLERPPAGMPVPTWMPVYVGGIVTETEKKAVWFEKLDDGGLPDDPDPVGKTFLLRGDYGMEIRITISGVETSGGGEAGRTWTGVGSVTHLTAAEDRTDPTLRLTLTGHGGAILDWQQDARDRAAYDADPLWEPLRAWNRHMDDKLTLWLDALLDS